MERGGGNEPAPQGQGCCETQGKHLLCSLLTGFYIFQGLAMSGDCPTSTFSVYTEH